MEASSSDGNETNCDLRTEFYTREGLWKLVANGEYVKHAQTPVQPQTYSQGTNNGINTNQSSFQQQTTSSGNDPVRLDLFRFKRTYRLNSVALPILDETSSSSSHKSYMCDSCLKSHNMNKNHYVKKTASFKLNTDEHDDDEDVVYDDHDATNASVELECCRVCKSKASLYEEETSSSLVRTVDSSLSSMTSTTSSLQSLLDLVVFNYAREIYFYELCPLLTHKAASSSDMKNLMHKKPYRTFMSTCFHINQLASIANSIDMQANSSPQPIVASNPVSVSLNDSNLSLIVAAGFSKGEIHVFDCFKKEASVFFNNSKLVDKTKVTCIRWLPNSLNFFLAGYSSGNIYLYDANIQTQATLAPVFSKLVQNESFSIFLNNQSSSTSHLANNVHSQTTPYNLNNSTNKINNQGLLGANSNGLVQRNLVLLSTNQTTTQTSKNPLLKLTIGQPSHYFNIQSGSSSTSSGADSSSSLPFFATDGSCTGANGVNEMAFSPCGTYLAVVSQDGFLRVFTFIYQSNQNMQIELRCSMKSYFGGLLCVCWSPDSKYIVTGGEDDLITVFSFTEMRVACRGRGHSSWVNACSFDPWTKLINDTNRIATSERNNTTKTNSKSTSDNEHDADSDLEEYYHNKQLKNLSLADDNTTLALSSSKSKSKSRSNKPKKSIYYRFASCGQDNQLCFWDLTEDVLREKQPSRSRVTSLRTTAQTTPSNDMLSSQLPQIIIQSSSLDASAKTNVSPPASSIQTAAPTHPEKHHSTTQSLVLSAKNFFSLKHSSDSSSGKYHKSHGETTSSTTGSDVTSTTSSKSNGGGFFKIKHKRNASLNNGMSSSKSSSSSAKLNSYRKSSNTTGISSITGSNEKTSCHYESSTNSNVRSRTSSTLPLNLCPKLNEVPMIEPLICKRIATERLTSMVFREDSLLISTQDGFVYTWARPFKISKTNELKANSTSL